MDKKLNLVEILKDCPKEWELYSPMFGKVKFRNIVQGDYPIVVELSDTLYEGFMADGKLTQKYDGECMLFPSKTQRDWSKFTAPWYKQEKFDPKTLQPFDKVLVRNFKANFWICKFLSHIQKWNKEYPYVCSDESSNRYCIPYNEDTKHLVGTNDEAPEYYRYWEN